MNQVAATLTVAHVGVTVPDIDVAMQFLGEALGFEVLVPSTEVEPAPGHTGRFLDAFFPGFHGMRVGRMVNGDGFALELFEWRDPELAGLHSMTPPDYQQPGYFHFAVIDPDVEERARRIVAAGGKRRTSTWRVFEGEPYLACYCEDPFGNIIEIISHDERAMHGAR